MYLIEGADPMLRCKRHQTGRNAMTSTTLLADKAPAHVPAATLKSTPRVEPLTCAIGAEVSNVNLGSASRDPDLMAEIRSLLLKHKVLFVVLCINFRT